MGLTDEAASLNEGSTLPGMQNAPYLGTWVMKDKGMDSFWSFSILYDSYMDHIIWSINDMENWVPVRQSDSEQSGRIKKTDSESMVKESILTNFSKV